MGNSDNHGMIIVMLGITGDLAAKRIVPAMYNLFAAGVFPSRVAIVAFGRREWDDTALREYIAKTLKSYHNEVVEEGMMQRFLEVFRYQRGEFDVSEDYERLAARVKSIDDGWGLRSSKLFHLSVPPNFYHVIVPHLQRAGLTAMHDATHGWTRVLVEKPFGEDYTSARTIDGLLESIFAEEQIFRIDHYLAKEMVQNILTFRFANDIFAHGWDAASIEKIDIRLHETLGVETRGRFYETVGALRDVGQNHLLQMLALVTMARPRDFSAEAIREARAAVLATLRPLTLGEVTTHTRRAQYEGYRTIEGVAPDSKVETYFQTTCYLDDPRWRGVPITLESGRRMPRARKEVEITFRHRTPCMCEAGVHRKNTLTFAMEPQEKIHIDLGVKQVGLVHAVQGRDMELRLRDARGTQYVEEYAKLLHDAVKGERMLFVSAQEIRAMWWYVDPILKAWQDDVVPLDVYTPDTDEMFLK